MVSALNKKAFKLPRVEKAKFVHLMRLGLDYNREAGVFSIKNCNEIEKVMDTIAGILGSDIVFLQTCIRCGKDFSCSGCKYDESCPTKNLPFNCVCPQCLKNNKTA